MSEQSITTFLEARLSEREARARQAPVSPLDVIKFAARAWAEDAKGEADEVAADALAWAAIKIGDEVDKLRPRTLHDPAYVLADIQSKRAILAEHALVESDDWKAQQKGEWSTSDALQYGCRRCDDEDGYIYGTNGCPTLRLLAAPFASHASYDTRWALDTGGAI